MITSAHLLFLLYTAQDWSPRNGATHTGFPTLINLIEIIPSSVAPVDKSTSELKHPRHGGHLGKSQSTGKSAVKQSLQEKAAHTRLQQHRINGCTNTKGGHLQGPTSR